MTKEVMRKSKNIEAEVTEAMDLVKNIFEDRCLQKTKMPNKLKNTNVAQTEVAFIKTFSKYMPEENHQEVNDFIDIVLRVNTLKDVQEELGMAAKSLTKKTELEKKKMFEIPIKDFNTSIHDDGIYDFDPKCVACKNKRWKKGIELLLLMAFSKGTLED